MENDVYDFFRGTGGVYLADQLRPDVDREPSTFLTAPSSASVLILGDPHLENFGSALAGLEPAPAEADAEAALSLEWSDMDSATFGPWTFDTRRAALSLALVGAEAGLDPEMLDDVVDRFARGWAGEIESRLDGAEPWAADEERDTDGAIIAALRAKARADGVRREELIEATTLDPDRGRELELATSLPADGRAVLPLGPRQSARLRSVIEAWPRRPEGFRLLEAGRAYGRGVASLPAVRFVVLWDQGAPGDEDDRLLNVREVIDPPSVDGVVPGVGEIFVDNADRITLTSGIFATRPDADVLSAAVQIGASTFKTTALNGWASGFDHEDIVEALVEGEATADDLAAFAEVLGHALAAAHARGHTLSGSASLAVIGADLAAGGGPSVFRAERVRDARIDLDTLRADYGCFSVLLQEHGPLVGGEYLVR
jgi:uncharacterized protein (DUF2252 family)